MLRLGRMILIMPKLKPPAQAAASSVAVAQMAKDMRSEMDN